MRCPSCTHPNPEDAAYCGTCGVALSRETACPSCGRGNPPEQRFCHGCGAALGGPGDQAAERDPRVYTPRHLADKILHAKSTLEGERKRITVLFVDIKGSMDLQEDLDPEAWHRIMDRFFQILTDGIHRFEGTINQYTGDGVMALFGAPIAHEDHAQRACYAALYLRGQIRGYTDELRLSHGLNFATRMGMNSGGVVVGKIGDDLRMDYTAQGQTVNLAARMQQLAEPGHIYLTGRTAEHVDGYFALRDVGPLRIKGIREEVRVWDLEGVGSLRTRLDRSRAVGFTRFVGRGTEIEMLDLGLERALQGQGQIVGVVAQAGVGKSRLCFEFVERCRHRGISVWDAHCPSHARGLSYLPFRELARKFFGVEEADGPGETRRKIAGALVLLDEDLREALPLAFDFMGAPDPERPLPRMDPEVRQRQLLALMRRLFEARSAREPAVLLIDDMHWIDPESDAFIAELVETVSRTRTLLLTNFRPEYSAPWMRRSDYHQIALQPLGPEATEELVGELLGGSESLEALKRDIRGRAGGNPFFIEEIVRELAETGVLEGTRGSYRVVGELETFTIPPTVESVLAARIDRLGSREKGVLETAAVVGQEISEPILRRVCALSPTELAAALDGLREGEFIREKALYPELEYRFAHPLTREVAYASQLSERRSKTHALVAGAIEASWPDRLDEHSPLLAQHWEAAGEPVEAARWYRRAAQREAQRAADVALRHWRRAWELLAATSKSPEVRRMRVEIGVELLFGAWLTGTPMAELSSVSEDTRRLARELGDSRALALATSAFAHLKSIEGDLDGSLADLAEAMGLARGIDDVELQINLHQRLGYSHYQAGDLARAMEHADRGLELCRADPDRRPRFGGYSSYGFLLAERGLFVGLRGDLAGAEIQIEQALSVAREEDDPLCLTFCLSELAVIGYLRGELAAARARAEEAVLFAERRLRNVMRNMAYSALIDALLHQEAWKAAMDTCAHVLASLEQPPPFHAYVLLQLAVAATEEGERPRAERAFEEARRFFEANPDAMQILTPRLHQARAARRLHGAREADAIRQDLDHVEARLRRSGDRALLPFVHEERAELAKLVGDGSLCVRELREAQRLFSEMGAAAHAARVESALAQLA